MAVPFPSFARFQDAILMVVVQDCPADGEGDPHGEEDPEKVKEERSLHVPEPCRNKRLKTGGNELRLYVFASWSIRRKKGVQ